jgi:hypothetical protein
MAVGLGCGDPKANPDPGRSRDFRKVRWILYANNRYSTVSVASPSRSGRAQRGSELNKRTAELEVPRRNARFSPGLHVCRVVGIVP